MTHHKLPKDWWDDDPEERQIKESFLSERPRVRDFFPVFLYALLSTLLSIFYWLDPSIKSSWGANADLVFHRWEWYRLLSGMMLHSNFRHLAANMLFLVPFGGLLTFYYGRRMFPVLAIVLGLINHALVLHTYPPNVFLNGSSGLLYVMFGLWLSLYYKVEVHLSTGKRWLRLIGFGLIMFIPSTVYPHVSYRTHYIGLLLGLVCGFIYAKIHEDDFRQRNLRYWESALKRKLH